MSDYLWFLPLCHLKRRKQSSASLPSSVRQFLDAAQRRGRYWYIYLWILQINPVYRICDSEINEWKIQPQHLKLKGHFWLIYIMKMNAWHLAPNISWNLLVHSRSTSLFQHSSLSVHTAYGVHNISMFLRDCCLKYLIGVLLQLGYPGFRLSTLLSLGKITDNSSILLDLL